MSNSRGPQCPSNMPPSQEPAMPARRAPTHPLGSLPGITAFAKAPTRAAVPSINSRPRILKLATMLTATRTIRVQRSSGTSGMTLRVLRRRRFARGRLIARSLFVAQAIGDEGGDDAADDAADEPARDGDDAKRAADDAADDARGDGTERLLIDVRHITPPTLCAFSRY